MRSAAPTLLAMGALALLVVVATAAPALNDDDPHATPINWAGQLHRPPPPGPPPPFTLHPLLGDNAVLQRAPERAAIYGWAEVPGAAITVRVQPTAKSFCSLASHFAPTETETSCVGKVHFRGEAYTGIVAGNDTGLGALMWRVELPPTPASSSPENITVTGLGATLTLANVLFGDVWMCGGAPAAFPAESPKSSRYPSPDTAWHHACACAVQANQTWKCH